METNSSNQIYLQKQNEISLNFQISEINKLKEELNKAKKIISQLESKNNELENKLKSINNINLKEINSLKEIINQKNQELNTLNKKLENININNNNNQKKYEKVVNFISNDQKVYKAFPCDGDTIFAEIEELLYRDYPEYRETNNTFLADGRQILRFKTIDDNKIGTGNPIMLIIPS